MTGEGKEWDLSLRVGDSTVRQIRGVTTDPIDEIAARVGLAPFDEEASRAFWRDAQDPPALSLVELRPPEPRRRSEFLYVYGAPILIYVTGLLLGIMLGWRFL